MNYVAVDVESTDKKIRHFEDLVTLLIALLPAPFHRFGRKLVYSGHVTLKMSRLSTN